MQPTMGNQDAPDAPHYSMGGQGGGYDHYYEEQITTALGWAKQLPAVSTESQDAYTTNPKKRQRTVKSEAVEVNDQQTINLTPRDLQIVLLLWPRMVKRLSDGEIQAFSEDAGLTNMKSARETVSRVTKKVDGITAQQWMALGGALGAAAIKKAIMPPADDADEPPLTPHRDPPNARNGLDAGDFARLDAAAKKLEEVAGELRDMAGGGASSRDPAMPMSQEVLPLDPALFYPPFPQENAGCDAQQAPDPHGGEFPPSGVQPLPWATPYLYDTEEQGEMGNSEEQY